MPTPQSAICPPASRFGIFLTYRVNPAQAPVVRACLADLPALTARIGAGVGEAGLLSAVGIGAVIWADLFGSSPPPGLVPFAALADGPRHAPATPADLFVHIRSSRHDANFALARAIADRLAGSAGLVEEIHGFLDHEGRDLTGFVDGTENPQGEDRATVALVPAGAYAAGSYVSIQRYEHRMADWQELAVAEQEAVIGRTKGTDEEFDDAVKPPSAHIARVVIEENGAELEILRHSLPYGTTHAMGLYFVAYCARPEPFRIMLTNMIVTDRDGHHDHLLRYTQAVTGAAFFVPSVEFLEG